MTGQGTRRQGSGSISTRNKENREEVPNHLWVESRDGYLDTRNHGNPPPSFLGVMLWAIALGLKTPKTLYFSWFWCPKKTWVSSTTIGGFWDRFLSLGLKLSASRELPRVWCVVLSPKIRPEKTKKLQGALSMRISYQGCVPPNLIHSSQSRQLGSNSVMVWENRLVHDSAAVIGETSVMTGHDWKAKLRISFESGVGNHSHQPLEGLLVGPRQFPFFFRYNQYLFNNEYEWIKGALHEWIKAALLPMQKQQPTRQ